MSTGKVCVFCEMWYDTEDITVCVKCNEYKGMVEITEEDWNNKEHLL